MVILALALLGISPVVRAAPASFAFSRSVALAWAPAPSIPLVGDLDGDGLPDLLTYYPHEGGFLDWARSTPEGKPRFAARAASGVGAEARAAWFGRFGSGGRSGVLLLLPDGALRLVTLGRSDAGVCRAAGAVDASLLAPGPLHTAVANLGGGECAALAATVSGELFALRLRPAADGGEYAIERIGTLAGGARRFAAAEGRCAWVDSHGVAWTAPLVRRGAARGLGIAKALAAGVAGEGLAMGRFEGDGVTRILLGERLFAADGAGPPLRVRGLPGAARARTDLDWIAADLDGDGRDDIVRRQRGLDSIDGSHVRVHYAFAGGDEVAGAPCGDYDNDGLLNAWETGAVRPGGIDLRALGCSPRHTDIVCEVQRFEDMPEAACKTGMEQVCGYYALLSVDNPDGVQGIALHVIHREPIAMAEASAPWWDLGARHHPESHRGVTHWMVVYNGGGGQSGEMTDRGGCGGHALYATFIHEFGHQIGLDHTGRWPAAWCPIYPSLMNYAYSYQIGGRPIGYSDGRLAGVVLDEHHLSEVLPFAPEQISYLAGPPYRFRMRATGDGRTLIDWNWNGVFGESDVAADINYGYSTTAGDRNIIGKTYSAPALATARSEAGEELLLFGARLPSGAALPPADAAAKLPSVSPEQPGSLYVRRWTGRSPALHGAQWDSETGVATDGVTGDPSACRLGRRAWVAYPTTAGVVLRAVAVRGVGVRVGAAVLAPGSREAQVSLGAIGGELAMLLWRGRGRPVGLVMVRMVRGRPVLGPETALGFASTTPPGLAEGGRQAGAATLWIGLMQDAPNGKPGRFQVRRLRREPGGAWREIGMEWVSGPDGEERGSSRVGLLHEPAKGLEPDGQLYFFACGLFSTGAPWACQYVCTRIADSSVNGGWLTRRYYDEWTQSRSAPGVCFFRGDIAFASRWFGNVHGTENDNLFVAYFGRGIETARMGDFDDVAFIRDFGITRSIGSLGEQAR